MLQIQLDRRHAGQGADGLRLYPEGQTPQLVPLALVRGMAITGFRGSGIRAGSHSVVSDNYVGVGPDGTTATGNREAGITLTGSHTTVGFYDTTQPLGHDRDGNVISGNVGPGVLLTGDAHLNWIAGNLIGVAADGASPLGNADGVRTDGAHLNVIGCREGMVRVDDCYGVTIPNAIAFNRGAGVAVAGPTLLSAGYEAPSGGNPARIHVRVRLSTRPIRRYGVQAFVQTGQASPRLFQMVRFINTDERGRAGVDGPGGGKSFTMDFDAPDAPAGCGPGCLVSLTATASGYGATGLGIPGQRWTNDSGDTSEFSPAVAAG